MMSSGRGPGVIGMVMALVVLLGFGLLFTFAFDEGLQGGEQTIESVIAGQVKEIDRLKHNIQSGELMLATSSSRNAAARDFSRVKAENGAGKDRIAKLKESVAATQTAIGEREQAFDNYKDQYRAFVRGGAKGKTMESLQTLTGVTYKNVTIKEVSAVGIQVRHEEGQKRIPFEELPDEMKDYYQFDPNQKEKAVALENAARDKHEAEADVANAAMDEKLAQDREKAKAEARVRTLAQISQKESQITGLLSDIRNLEREQDRAEAAAASARAAGNIVINKGSSIGGKIRAKQNQVGVLQAEIANMKARL